MPRDYEKWQIDPESAAAIRDAFDRKALGGLTDPKDIRAVADRIGRGRLAEILSGTTDKRSRAYKNQRDNISRWIAGRRKVGAKSVPKVTEAIRRDAAKKLRDRGSVRFKMGATFVTSKKPWMGLAQGVLSGDDLREFAAAVEAGDYERASQIGAGTYFDDPNVVQQLRDLDELDF